MNFFKRKNKGRIHSLTTLSKVSPILMLLVIILAHPVFVSYMGLDGSSYVDSLSKFASYISNIVAPLAFLWMVSSQMTQVEMLSSQLQDSKTMLKIMQEQFEAQQKKSEVDHLNQFLSAQPNFINVDTIKHRVQGVFAECCKVKFTNVGLDASYVFIEDEFGFCMSEKLPIIKRGESVSMEIDLPFFSEDFSAEGTSRVIKINKPDDGGDEDLCLELFPDIEKCWISYNDMLGVRQRAHLHLHYSPFLIDGKRMIRASIDMQERPNQYKPTPFNGNKSVDGEDVN